MLGPVVDRTMKPLIPFTIVCQSAADVPATEALLDQCFGLARRSKTTYRLREGESPVPGLSHVAWDPTGRLIGANSFWEVRIGETGAAALLLGPLAVASDLQGLGIGRALMRHGLEAATRLRHRLVILVGDEPYYGRVGFRQVPSGLLQLPGPVDEARLLYLELETGALQDVSGLVLGVRRFNGLRDTK